MASNDSDRDWRSLSAQWTDSDRDAEREQPRIARRYTTPSAAEQAERLALALARVTGGVE
jgi:hypothetical protein